MSFRGDSFIVEARQQSDTPDNAMTISPFSSMKMFDVADDLTSINENAMNDESEKGIYRTQSISVSATVTQLVYKMNNWDLDVFKFAEETGDRPLYSLMRALFTKYQFLQRFRIDRDHFKKFEKSVKAAYRPLPYHNVMRAADMVNSIHHLLSELKLGQKLEPLKMMAAIVAAAVHDMRHPGRNNRFMQLIHHSCAIVYSDQSILERMHLAEAFKLMRSEGQTILQNLNIDEYLLFRKLVISMVLATDLAQHLQMVTKLQNLKKSSTEESDSMLLLTADETMVLEVAIKAADIGHSAKTWELHKVWSDRICEEFFQQGDEEKKLGLTISPFMNRLTPQTAKNQVGFFDYIVLPLYNSMTDVYSSLEIIRGKVKSNYDIWKVMEKKGEGG